MKPRSSLLPWAGIPGSPQNTAKKIKKSKNNVGTINETRCVITIMITFFSLNGVKQGVYYLMYTSYPLDWNEMSCMHNAIRRCGMVPLTKALGSLSAPVAAALAC